MTIQKKPYVVFGYGSLIFKVNLQSWIGFVGGAKLSSLQPPPHVIAQSTPQDILIG